MIEPFPLIEISGPPRERGRQYGRQAAERIVKGRAYYGAQLDRLKLDGAAVAGLVRDYLPLIEQLEPAYVGESAESPTASRSRSRTWRCSMRSPRS